MRVSLVFLLFIFSFFNPLYADSKNIPPIHQLRSSIHLGTLDFKTSTKNKQARDHFLLGSAFLHAFMYDLAIKQFQQAQKLDPGFSMAYWGEALSYKNPIWNIEDLTRAREVIARYYKHKDSRQLSVIEENYIKSAAILFNSQSLRERDLAYLQFMQQFYLQFPNDPNVGALYALSLLGFAADFPNDTASNGYIKKGRALINRLFKKYPHHPGVLHYYLHYHDTADVTFAKQALPATKIALSVMSSSSHVTHMSAHIYRRLELWDDYILANEISVRAADSLCTLLQDDPLYACNAENKYHSLEWLQEGYLRKHRTEEAATLTQEMAHIVKQDNNIEYKQWLYRMWARQVLWSKNWTLPAITILPISTNDSNLYWSSYSECGALLAASFINIHTEKSITAELHRLDTVIALTNRLTDPYIKQTCEIAKLEIQAEAARVKKDKFHADYFTKKALSEQKKQISTELTPSLSFLPADVYYKNFVNS